MRPVFFLWLLTLIALACGASPPSAGSVAFIDGEGGSPTVDSGRARLDSRAVGPTSWPSTQAGAAGASDAEAAAGQAEAAGDAGTGGAPDAPPRHRAFCLVYIGQSNMCGADWRGVPVGLPDATIPLWLNDFYYNDGTHAFGPLRVSTHGLVFSHEIRAAQRFREAGYDVAVIKLTQGATYINRWIPGAKAPSAASKVYVELAEAVAALPAQFPPDTDITYFWTWDQGEEEARYKDVVTVQAWSDDFALIRAGVEAILGPVDPYVIRTSSNIAGKTFPGVLEAEQASVVSRPEHLIDTNDVPLRTDDLHRTGPGQNMVGERLADVMLRDVAR